MEKKNIRCGENFFLGFFVYAVIVLAAKWAMNIFDNIIIAFTPAKALAELKTDPAFLFNVTYPFLTFFVLVLFYALLFGAFYFASYKFAFKYDSTQPKKNIYLQMIVIFVVITFYSLYNSVVKGHIMPVFWYSGAFWSGLFGIVDKADAVNQISTYDFSSIAYIIQSITPNIGGFIIVSELLTYVCSFFVSMFARKLGSQKGINKRIALREELFKNSPNYTPNNK